QVHRGDEVARARLAADLQARIAPEVGVRLLACPSPQAGSQRRHVVFDLSQLFGSHRGDSTAAGAPLPMTRRPLWPPRPARCTCDRPWSATTLHGSGLRTPRRTP